MVRLFVIATAAICISFTAGADIIKTSFYCNYSEQSYKNKVYYKVFMADPLWSTSVNSQGKANDIEFECFSSISNLYGKKLYIRGSGMTLVINELTNSVRPIIGVSVNGGPTLHVADGKVFNESGRLNTFYGSDEDQESFVFQSLRQLSTNSERFNILFRYQYGSEMALFIRDKAMAKKVEQERSEMLVSNHHNVRSTAKEIMHCPAAFAKLLRACISIRKGWE